MCKLSEKDHGQIVTAVSESLKSLVGVSERVRRLEIEVEFAGSGGKEEQMVDERKQGDQLQKTLNDMRTDIGTIKSELANIPSRMKRVTKWGAYFSVAVFYFTLGFGFLVPVVTFWGEKWPLVGGCWYLR